MLVNANSTSRRPADQSPTVWAVIVFALLTLFGIWPALTNGQPFFYADTSAYVRGADMAICKALGPRFATAWAKDDRRAIAPANSGTPAQQQSAIDAAPRSTDNKSNQRVILAGRSIIYGALLYLGEITGGMWIAVLLQSLIAVWLIFAFTVRTLGLSFRLFVLTTVALFSISSLPFLISNLMPDVLAGFLILAFAILAVAWQRLSFPERAAASAIILFAVLAHTTHLILLFALAVCALAYAIVRRNLPLAAIRPLTTIAASCIVLAIAWEAAFSFAVTRSMGAAPVRPPFVMAKLVSGLGPGAVAQVCASHNFVVCKFQDRFPIDNESFLWPEPYHAGVFSDADVPTKRALSAEQYKFALAIIPPNLARFIGVLSRDAASQLVHFNLDEYSYTPAGLNFFRERMPANEFQRMTATWAARFKIYVIFGRTFLLATTIISLIATLAFLLGAFPSPFISEQQGIAWRTSIYIFVCGLLLNAIVCGGFSGINNRYQARVIWLLPLSLVSAICLRIPQRKLAVVPKLNAEERNRQIRDAHRASPLDKVVSINRETREHSQDSHAFFVD